MRDIDQPVMDQFQYRDGRLHAEDVALDDIAHAVGTPFYCYSATALEKHYTDIRNAFAAQNYDALICFAVKANSNQAVLSSLARLGAGMDVVSGGELRRARLAGVPGERTIFAGVGKTRQELEAALAEQILSFNVESQAELHALSQVASACGQTAGIALRINPDVDAKTHAKISTGKAENKFGIAFDDAVQAYALAASLPGLRVDGIHMHIGSQITELQPFEKAFERMRDLAEHLIKDGHALRHLDIGGGLGVDYHNGDGLPPSAADYAALATRILGHLKLRFVMEPGRAIAANAGVFVTEVIAAKHGAERRFAIVDGAMNDLLRPTLYE
ncbi:MAG: diaminopimelate decarboxylase, partial [Pseudomonadota bacterium]